MKGARIRYQQTGEFHFLTFSCFHRRPYLSAGAAMDLFEDALERVRRRYLFVVGGYVVMPEHVHLLVNEPGRGPLSRTVQALKLSVSMRSRERPFWQAHYYDFNISTHDKFVEKLRYIHRNPVRRGLAARPEDWKWSSFRHYRTGMRGIVEIESVDSPRERLATARVDALPASRISLPGPQLRGTGGTLNLIKCSMRPGPPAVSIIGCPGSKLRYLARTNAL
jgi:putative transposase